jgi:hypothetical protein
MKSNKKKKLQRSLQKSSRKKVLEESDEKIW